MIHLTQFTRRFGKHVAVDGVTLFIPEKQIFGLIGPNGAGKTTIFRFLATLLAPTSGGGRICGYDVVRHYRIVRQLLGFMPDSFGVYPGMRVDEFLAFFAQAHGIAGAERRRLVGDILDLVDLGAVRARQVETLSRGMRQRLCLGRALLHNPRVLILDEPAAGLDPRARREVQELIRTLAELGKTILISSHILAELGDICTSVGFLDQGHLVRAGKLDDVLAAVRPHRVFRVELVGAAEPAQEALRARADVLRQSAPSASPRGRTVIQFEARAGDEEIAALHADMLRRGARLVLFEEQQADLEEAFLKITADSPAPTP